MSREIDVSAHWGPMQKRVCWDRCRQGRRRFDDQLSAPIRKYGPSRQNCDRSGQRRYATLTKHPGEEDRASRSLSLADHVRRVPVILYTNALDEIRIRFQPPGQLDRPWL